jgi:hypothetical protein
MRERENSSEREREREGGRERANERERLYLPHNPHHYLW